jgi:hypothetical protein
MNNLLKKLSTIPYLVLGIGLAVLGVLAMSYIVNAFWPFDVQDLDLIRAVALDEANPVLILDSANYEIILSLLAMVVLTVSGMALPLVYYLNKRFNDGVPQTFWITFRQSIWVGMWVAFCTWLRMNRALGLAVALLVAAVLILFEILLQVRTRAESQAQVFGEGS